MFVFKKLHMIFIKKLNLNPSITKYWKLVQKHLMSSGAMCMKRYIIQWEGDDRVGRYKLMSKRKGEVTRTRCLGVKPVNAIEKSSRPVLDLRTGVYYDTISELALSVGLKRETVNWRLNNNFYKGRYIV